MLVEDDSLLSRSLVNGFTHLGYEVVAVGAAGEALRRLKDEDVDVLISDQNMPDLPGTELLARVRRDHPDVVRILYTGVRELKVAQDAINRGKVHRYLPKPFALEDLAREIRHALRETRDETARRLRRRLLRQDPRLAATEECVTVDPLWAANVADGLRASLASTPSRLAPTRPPPPPES